jgi:diguanylate cyclase (GGDEF)-like protein
MPANIDPNQDQFYLKRYVAPFLPIAMASTPLSLMLLWVVYRALGRPHGAELAFIELGGSAVLLVLTATCRWLARNGRLHATSLVVVAYGGLLATILSVRTSIAQDGLLTVMPACMTLVLIGALFAHRFWHLLVGFAATMTPPVILAMRIDPDVSNEGQNYPQVLVFSLTSAMLLYGLTTYFKRRFHALLVDNLERSQTDSMTRLLNRTAWQERAVLVMNQRRGASSGVAVLYLDVDRFKQINDRLGHAVGDEAIRNMADLLRQVFSPDALISRYGGDEFVTMLPDSGKDDVVRCANHLRASFAERFSAIGGTVSVGGAMHEPGESVDHLVRRADLALLRAKAMGRDRVVIDRDGADAGVSTVQPWPGRHPLAARPETA